MRRDESRGKPSNRSTIGAEDMGAGGIQGEGGLIAGFAGQVAGTLQGEGAGGSFKVDEGLVAQAFDQADAGGERGVLRIRGDKRRVFGADAEVGCRGRVGLRAAGGQRERRGAGAEVKGQGRAGACDFGGQEVHRGRADEGGDKAVGGVGV